MLHNYSNTLEIENRTCIQMVINGNNFNKNNIEVPTNIYKKKKSWNNIT